MDRTLDPPADTASPRWLSHHGAHQRQRCCRIGHTLVCRRCLALYPVAAAVAVLAVLADPPAGLATAAMWLLPVPFVVEWTLEHLTGLRYSPRRQVAVTLLAAPALGLTLAAHARDPFTLVAVVPMAVWGSVCAVTALVGTYRSLPEEEPGWLEAHERAEAERLEGLRRLLEGTDRRSDDVSGTG